MPSRNVSLRLRDLQEKDSGSYLCFVNLQDNQGTVKGQSSKHLELDVLVPPAPPSCHLRGVAHVGTNVTLSCQSPRNAIHGSLSLKNLSTSMSGVYVCKAHNEVGSAQCNVTLTVSTGPRATVVAGAVVGTMVGLGLLAGLVLLYQHRGKALEEPANDIKVSLSLQSSHSDPSPSLECPPNPKPGTPHPSHLTASEIGEKGTTEGAPGLAVEVKVPSEPLSAPVGKTAELTCSYSTSVGDNFALEWSFVQPGKPVSMSQPILYFTNGQLYPTGSKAERASLLQNPPTGGVATLKLTDVRPSDAGTYLCHVNNPPDFYTNGLGLINLTVLVPPSRPSCSQSGQTSVGGSAALRCSSSTGAPKPVYNWIRLGASPTPSPGSMVQDEVSGQLILTNLSLASSGTYRCVATNQMGSASCELTLSVTDPSKGRVAGTVIGVLLGVLFLSVAVFCLIRFQKERRKRPKETFGGSDLREDAVAPGVSEQPLESEDSSNGLLERPSSASTVTTKSKLPMVV
ncbi:hypothetical protein MJG53_016718 [Ovis ammon polii x Ovis aries]|uniref:Uncharacterized protein n=1 Tax=Ovis ammon polii x Ovis aries TaxID=2918886 RepID=A0ACB9U9P8_9CETA|nr:hypothetical protein MJG53_016718 [Ovis ammon polii x Ovis aries]